MQRSWTSIAGMTVALLGIYLLYVAVWFAWFFFGAIIGWVMAFQWVPMYMPWEMPVEFVIVTIPHALLLGCGASLVMAFFSFRKALLIAAAPIVYAAVGVVGFLLYMLIS